MTTVMFPARVPESRMRKSTRRAAAYAEELIGQSKMPPDAACKEAGISLRTLERYREERVEAPPRASAIAQPGADLTLFTQEQAQILADMRGEIRRLDRELSDLLQLFASHAKSLAQSMDNQKVLRDYEATERASQGRAPSTAT